MRYYGGWHMDGYGFLWAFGGLACLVVVVVPVVGGDASRRRHQPAHPSAVARCAG